MLTTMLLIKGYRIAACRTNGQRVMRAYTAGSDRARLRYTWVFQRQISPSVEWLYRPVRRLRWDDVERLSVSPPLSLSQRHICHMSISCSSVYARAADAWALTPLKVTRKLFTETLITCYSKVISSSEWTTAFELSKEWSGFPFSCSKYTTANLNRFLLRPRKRLRSIVMSASVCEWVCVRVSVCEHICRTTRAIFAKFCVRVAYGRGSVLLRRGDAIPMGKGNFGGFHWQCIVRVVRRIAVWNSLRRTDLITLNLLLYYKVGQNSISQALLNGIVTNFFKITCKLN